MSKLLSKSQYKRGTICPKSLWLYNYRRDLLEETPASAEMLFEQGNQVGLLAQTHFPDGVLIEEDNLHIKQALAATQKAIDSGAKVIYEGAFSFNGLLVRADILVKGKTGAWDVVEVKSATAMDDSHVEDIAFQYYVLKGAGLKLNKAGLLYLNKEYVRSGAIDVKELFKLDYVTKDVKSWQIKIKANIKNLVEILSQKKEPVKEIGSFCNAADCGFSNYCWQDVPEASIYTLPRIKASKTEELRAMGILNLADVPDTFKLSDNQKINLLCAKTGKPHVDAENIRGFIDKLQYPLYFLDFETIAPAIPLYDGTRPYQQITFQASLHVQTKKNGKLKHIEFLGDAKTDPRKAMAKFLVDNMGTNGSIVAYNSAFECSRIKELAQSFPELSTALSNMLERFTDLAAPFRSGHYVHPDFRGSFSIKVVLPALVPSMTYKGLTVANGGDAQVAYLSLMSGKLAASEVKTLRDALKTYCGQDTLAMVEILKVLLKIAGN